MLMKRIVKHLLVTDKQLKAAFPQSSLQVIEKAIKASEALHKGEIRFAVEAALNGAALLNQQTAKERAIELFSQLRVWDTQDNNGLLIYLLLADRAVEIVADRGIHARVGTNEWRSICDTMESAFRQSHYESGVISGVQSATKLLVWHFPASGRNPNQLPDAAVII